MLKTIILDLDGTLVRLPIPWSRFYEKLKKLLGNEMKFLEFVSKYFGTPRFWDMHRYLENLELEAVEEMHIYDDTREFIDFVKENFEKIAVVTMQSSSACLKILEKLDLLNHVSLFISRECAPTRIDQIRLALHLMRVDPSKCVFIGDKVLDGVAAYVNGVAGFVVVRGSRVLRISDTDDVEEDLRCLGIRIVGSLREVIEALRKVL